MEKIVHKVKLYLKKSEILNQFLTPNFTSSEMETILSSLVSTLNSRPLAIYKNKILTPQSYFFHTFKMSPIADSTIPIIKSTETSLEDQIKNAVVDSKYEKMRE